jgi:hypothetical protein
MLGLPDDDLDGLLAETNDQRRRVGQTLYHFYRSLVFWHAKGRTFHATTKAWAAAGEAVFAALAASLGKRLPHQPDAVLRRYVGRVLGQLADDLERGDHMLVPFLRWIEARFPELTKMMQAETPDSRIYDVELAVDLRVLFGDCARADRPQTVRRLREVAASAAGP